MSPVCLHGVLFVILVMNLPEIVLAHLTIYNNRSYPFKYNLYMDASLQSLFGEAANTDFIVCYLTRQGASQQPITLEVSTLIITPPMRLIC
jgi:hypothetical protein